MGVVFFMQQVKVVFFHALNIVHEKKTTLNFLNNGARAKNRIPFESLGRDKLNGTEKTSLAPLGQKL